MKVLTCTTPGKLEYADRAEPVLTANNAIIRINRVGICGTDLHAFEGTQPYFSYPRILGHELAAELVAFDNAPEFSKGDSVTVVPYFYCGKCIACRTDRPNCCTQLQVCGVHIDGAMSMYLSVPSYSLVHGQGLTDDILALVEPFAIGAHAVGRANIRPEEFVVVVGAGPIGLGIMEFARIAGARVIAIDRSENRLQFCREQLTSAITIDAGRSNVIEALREITSGDMVDVVYDATGNRDAINNSFQYMAHGGRYILVGLQKGEVSFSHPEFHKREATLMSSRNATREDFDYVISCLKRNDIDPARYITHRVSFDEVKDVFQDWLNPESRVIKAMVSLA